MKIIKTSIFCVMLIVTTTHSTKKAIFQGAIEAGGKVVELVIDKSTPVITAESGRWVEAFLVISERTGVSVDKMTVVADKLGTGMLYVAAAGVTIYSIKLVCNAGCTIKSSLWPSEEEIQAKLAQCVETEKRIELARQDIRMLQAKQTFEKCLDRHITEPGFPAACENVARAYAKFNRHNEVNDIKDFFNQSR